MYVVVREDMPAANQAVQAAHALADFATKFPKEFKAWNTDNNTLVLLAARDQRHLRRLEEQAKDGNFKYVPFVEPDPTYVGVRYQRMPGTITAIAFAPNWYSQYAMLADLPLALPMDKKERRRRRRRCDGFGLL